MKSPKTSSSIKPKIIEQEYKVNPEQGLAALLAVQVPPKGYCFTSMKRNGNKAVVIYTLESQ
jgi:hypothetical protein